MTFNSPIFPEPSAPLPESLVTREETATYFEGIETVVIDPEHFPNRFYEDPQYEPYVPKLPKGFVLVNSGAEQEAASYPFGGLVGTVSSFLSRGYFLGMPMPK